MGPKIETLLALLIQYVDLVVRAAVACAYCWFLSKRYLPQETGTTVLSIIFPDRVPCNENMGKNKSSLFTE